MLPRRNRVPKALFGSIMKTSRSFHSSYFSLRMGRISHPAVRCAVVVSKKVNMLATRRNTIRRRYYAALSCLVLAIQPGSVVLVFVKKSSENLTPSQLQPELKNAFLKVGLLNKHNLIQ